MSPRIIEKMFPPHLLGATSSHPFVQAVLLVDCGFTVMRVGDATKRKFKKSNIEMLYEEYREYPDANWRVVCGRDFHLVVLHCESDADIVALESEWGPLPVTWLVTRESGGTFFWFSATRSDPKFRLMGKLGETRATLKSTAPIPGSQNENERYHWIAGRGPAQTELAPLPRDWMNGLPVSGISSRIVVRPEFAPTSLNPYWHD